jgi:hypothetical protein
VILAATDLAVEIDTGTNKPGALQRLEDGEWVDYLPDGKQVTWPVRLEELPPGRYRVRVQP